MTDYAPCTTCGQYSHSIGEGQVTAAFNHFQSMYSHRSDGIPTQNVYDDRTRDAAQVLMAAARGMPLREDAGTAAEAEGQQPGGEATRPNTLDYANKSEREAAYWRERCEAIIAAMRDAIASGYPWPREKVERCEHSKFKWEDCIACYDDFLEARLGQFENITPETDTSKVGE